MQSHSWCKALLIFDAVLAWVGCGLQTVAPSDTTSMIQANDLKLVPKSERHGLANAVGSLAVVLPGDGSRVVVPVCTAVRLGHEHLLTAAHCVQGQQIFNPWAIAAEGASVPGRLEFVQFGDVLRLTYQGDVYDRSEMWSASAPILDAPVYVNPKLDFAVFRLPSGYSEALASFGDGISLAQEKTSATRLAIWGHPHGVPLTKAECSRGAVVAEPWFHHDCDALNGSSGGLIGDAVEERPIAMQLAGPLRNSGAYYQGHGAFETPEVFANQRGCGAIPEQSPEREQCVATRGLNRALPLSAVRQDLMKHHPEIL